MAWSPKAEAGSVEFRDGWLAVQGLGPVAEAEVVLAAWSAGGLSAGTDRRVGDLVARFAKRVTAVGRGSLLEVTEQDCESFLWTPTRRNRAPSLHTVHLRRTALRVLYRTLAHLEPTAPDPTVGLVLPAKPEQRARPLTDAEIDLVRTAALGRVRGALRAAAVVALAEATATTGELPQVLWTDINWEARTVRLRGADPIKARVGSLTDWGVGVLGRWKTHSPLPPEAPIVGRRTQGVTRYAAQAAMSSALSRLISSAGINDPDVRPSSIRLWAAARTLDAAGIEAAARALGIDSLDAAAAALGHDWQAKP